MFIFGRIESDLHQRCHGILLEDPFKAKLEFRLASLFKILLSRNFKILLIMSLGHDKCVIAEPTL